MALDTIMQNAFDKRMDQMKEDGFFLPSQRTMSGDTRYLIVSYGGTGAAALFGVKKKLETVLNPVELQNRVRFLGIDTDKETQHCTKQIKGNDGTLHTIETDALSNDQFYQLSGSAAKLILNVDKNIDDWLNPKMKDIINKNKEMLNGDGASGIRQLGRLTLYPATTKASLTSRVRALLNELTNGNAAPLKVFVLTGIAGGTGSGTVIDLTYLLRDIVNSTAGGLATRTSFAGFILLPPTGDKGDNPTAVQHGNRNGYAALKEIEHFMTLPERSDTYDLLYGDGSHVRSQSKIFDICYLMDGGTDMVKFSDPRAKAVGVLAESLLDMITASQTVNGNQIQTVDSFMNDCHTMTMAMVSSKPVAHAPRDSDYIYCALGHCEFTIPTNEIKAYVGKQFFDKIYQMFLKCGNVEESDVKDFIKAVISEGVSTQSAVKKAVEKQVNLKFNDWRSHKGGPYYVINLLYDAPQEIQQIRARAKVFRPGMVSDQSLDWIEQMCLSLNSSIFNVYNKAMDAMKDLMESQYNMVVKADITGNTYSFIPMDMGTTAGSNVVITYLDSLISKQNLKDLMDGLLQDMLNNREKWTDLYNSGSSETPAVMRAFWNEHLDKIINSTLEDFLIKYYSGDPNAHFSNDNYAETLPYLQNAAQAIYSSMLSPSAGGAQPLLALTSTGLTPADFNAHTYLLVPSCAPNLLQELKNVAAANAAGMQVDVCDSLSTDRISCYKQYTSVPAFKMQWTCAAENDYELGLRTEAGVGLHMSETPGGNLWRNFSNLLPMSCWPILPRVPQYHNNREAQLANKAQMLFRESNALGLVSGIKAAAGTDNLQYTAKILPAQYRPDDSLFKNLDLSLENTAERQDILDNIDKAVEMCANRLLAVKIQKGAQWEDASELYMQLKNEGVPFADRNLWFTSSVLTVGPADVKPQGWDEYVAGTMLRKMPEVMNEMDGTLMVIRRVHDKIAKMISSRKLVSLFAQYLCCDLFTFDSVTSQWTYTAPNGLPVNMCMVVGPVPEACQYYSMFNYLRDNTDAVNEAMQKPYAAVAPLSNAPDALIRLKRYMARAQELLQQFSVWNNTTTPLTPYAAAAATVGIDAQKVENFHRRLIQELQTAVLGVFVPALEVKTDTVPKIDPKTADITTVLNTGDF